MKRLNLLLSMFLISSFYTYSQQFDWAFSIGGTGVDQASGVTLDEDGNVYVTGNFSNTVDFDPSEFQAELTTEGGSGDTDSFLSKYTSSGEHLWTKSWGNSMSNVGYRIALDSYGDVILTGTFQDEADFDPGEGVFFMTSNGNADSYILKLSSEGEFIWAKHVGGESNDSPRGLTIDNSGNILVAGNYSGSVDFDPGSGVYTLMNSGGNNGFILKLDANGDFIFANRIGSNFSIDSAESVITDNNGNVIVTGQFSNTTDFNPSTDSEFLISSNGSATDAYLVKYDPTGNFIFAKSIGGTSHDSGKCVAVLYTNQIIWMGNFSSETDLNPNAGEQWKIPQNDATNLFFILLEPDGAFEKARSFGDNGYIQLESLIVDHYTNLWFCGTYNGTPNMGTEFSPNTLSEPGSSGAYFTKINRLGDHKYTGTTNGDGISNIANSLAADIDANLYVVGHFSADVDGNPFEETQILTSNGDMDIIIQRLRDPLCPGDFNNDYAVTIDDISIFLSDFGCIDNCSADLTGDFKVTLADISNLLAFFGTYCD